jgi:hypothetical protein
MTTFSNEEYAEARLNNIQEFSPYRKENTFTVTKISRLTLFKEITAVYTANQTNPTNKKKRC